MTNRTITTNTDTAKTGLTARILPNWLSHLGILLGLCLVAFSFFGAGVFGREIGLGLNDFRLTLCVGFGLILTGFGTRATGTWKSWNVAGAGAAATMLFLLLWVTDKEAVSMEDPALVARIEGGFHPGTKIVQVEAPSTEKLYTTWVKVGRSMRVRIERRHLKSGCITFVEFVPTDDGRDSTDLVSYIPTAYFQNAFRAAKSAKTPADLALRYDNDTETLFADENRREPISFPSCPVGFSDEAPTDSRRHSAILPNLLDLIVGTAHAGDKQSTAAIYSKSEALHDLNSKNALVRREARQSLVQSGPESVPQLLQVWQENPRSQRLQLGVASVLSAMLDDKAAVRNVRAQLSDRDVANLVNLIAHRDKATRRAALSAVLKLSDPRSVTPLLDILRASRQANGRYNAALVLNRTYGRFDNRLQRRIAREAGELAAQQGPETRKLLEALPTKIAYRSAPVRRGSQLEGWSYLGINYGSEWQEKHFSWTGNGEALPRKGDILTTNGRVNLRENHIRFDRDDGWVNAPVISVLRPKQQVEVTDVETVAAGYHWVKVRRIN